MNKYTAVYGKEVLDHILSKYNNKHISINQDRLIAVKRNRTWRKLRHLKTIYEIVDTQEYSAYKQKYYEIVFSRVL